MSTLTAIVDVTDGSLAAPTAAGSLSDLAFTEGQEIGTIDLSTDFAGEQLTFALAPSSDALPSGLALSSAGVLSGTPTAVVTGRNIVVRATNSAGSADSAFTLDVEAAGTLNPAPSGAAVSITAQRTTGTAPAGIFFSATASGFGVADHYSDVRYRWIFEDPGYYTRNDVTDLPWDRVYDDGGTTKIVRGREVYAQDGVTKLAETAVLGPEGFEPSSGTAAYLGPDSNIAYGPHVGHVFAAPGTYTVKCEVRRRGYEPVTQSVQVTIDDADTVFAGTDTIVVSGASDFSGKPANAQEVTSFSAAISAAGGGGKKRILFRRGETFSSDASTPSGTFTSLQFGAFGSGNPPVLDGNGIRADKSSGETTIWGLDIKPSSYDPSDPNGSTPYNTGLDKQGDNFTTLWDCEISGCINGILVGLEKLHLVVGDVFVTNWHNYGFFANRSAGFMAMCGYFAKQNVDAVIGEGKSESSAPYYVDHGPWRASTVAEPVAFNLCDLRSVGTWGAPQTLFQPCLRIGRSTGINAPVPEEASMERMRMENGGGLGTGNSDANTAYPRKYLWDKCYLLVQNEGDNVFSPGVLGLHWRNVTAIIADVGAATPGNAPTNWIQRPDPAKGADDDASMGNYGIDLYNCTLVDMRSGYGPMEWDTALLENGGTAGGGTQVAADHVAIGNNVVHAPNKSEATETGDAPLDGSQVWSSAFPGVVLGEADGTINSLDTGYEIPASNFALFAPETGSAAIGDADVTNSDIGNADGAQIAVDDFFGNVRGNPTSRGAFEGP